MANKPIKPLRKPKEEVDYAFCLIIGSVYIYALTRTIFAATIIRLEQGVFVTMAVASIIIFLIAFHNRITRIVSLSAAIIFALYMLNLVRTSTYYDMHPRIEHFYNLINMIGGLAPFDPSLGRTAVWIVSMLFGMVVAIFMLHKFSFIVLAVTGALVFALTWGPGFSRDETSFLLFLFVFIVLLIRKMNRSVSSAFWVAPLCALIIWFANGQLPTNSEMFVRRSINQFTGVMETIGDRMFEIFNPTYFSFQSTGFSGAGGRLGGPVTVNNRTVMDVYAPGGIYLAGAVSNTYTGFSWIPTLEDGDMNHHGLPPGQFEMLETAAALIRGATIANERASISPTVFTNIATTADYRRLHMRHFPVMGVLAGGGYYLHSYLPIDTVSISMGRQRTGTIFRPINAWGLEFAQTGTNYLPVTNFLPTGDMQTPGFMSRGTGYHMQFLNVNPQFSFVEYLLRQTNQGVYSLRAGNDNWWQQATFGGDTVGLESGTYWHRFNYDPRDIRLRARGNQPVRRADIPEEYIEWWWPDPSLYYYIHRVYEHAPHVFVPVPACAVLLEEVNEMWAGVDPTITAADMNEALHRVIASVPDGYTDRRLALSVGDEGTLQIGYFTFGEPIRHSFFAPLTNYWHIQRDYMRVGYSGMTHSFNVDVPVQPVQQVSLEISHFENIPAFGVAEMQILVDLFTETTENGELSYIPRESYLLHWLDMFSVGVLAEYSHQVHRHFMDVPETVPQRVYDLTMQIVDGYTNDFDRVMAIRNYLLQFPYTLTPAHVPRGVCFVDHFLFVGQAGYCTYFASAMAIMARIAGVPSRYVEGFVLPQSGNPMEHVTVTNRMAHAWAEVYLEGFGWLIVEATPTYAFLSDPTAPIPAGGGAGVSPVDDWRMMADRMGDPEMEMDGMWAGGSGAQGAGTTQGTTDEPVPRNTINVLLWLPIFAAVGVVIFILLQFCRVVSPTIKMRKLLPNRQVIAYFEGILDIVSYYTTPMEPGETPKIYGMHKGKRFAYKSDSVFFRDLITLYYKAKYSPHQVTKKECELMEEAYFDMVNLLKMRHLPVVFLYLRYICRVGALAVGDKISPTEQVSLS